MKKPELEAENRALKTRIEVMLTGYRELRSHAANEQVRANVMERRANDAQQLADLLTVRLAQALTDNETLRETFGVNQ